MAGRDDDTVITRAFTGKTLRAIRNSYTQHFEDHPEELQPFPGQIGRSMSDGTMHLGAAPIAEGIDPARECYAAGQGIGGIDAVVPAGELVHRIVEEAERALDAAAARRVVRT